MATIEELAEYFAKLPSIGPRQAKRFVHYLLRQDKQFLEDFAAKIGELREHVAMCNSCRRYFAKRRAETECIICMSPRNEKLIMIIEKDVDLDNVERVGGYDGYYFVLGGTIPLSGQHDGAIHSEEIVKAVEKRVPEGLSEIILAMGANPDGEHTASEVRGMLEPTAEKHGLTITTLGRGLSTGLELEYSDAATIKSALQNRA